ncbi:MAG: hypothetical protein HGA36_01465 [Candidatus Moranbacteria bacterium]|nr:hypothetical protein [Candidatus Moranbacteria bacterium]
MKKNTKKQLNKKKVIPSKKKKNVLVEPKKKNLKRVVKKAKVKTKAASKKTAKAVLKQKTKNVVKKSIRRAGKQDNHVLTFGEIHPASGKILLLIILIIIAFSIFLVQSMTRVEVKKEQPKVAGITSTRNIAREKEINDMVQGYPIEKMTRYIAKQEPKVAAFMIAIAKKESAWGDRKPVLDGEDCYNYWGFRLKSDRMGSGGHTCFDSPEEAVAIVGTRISHLVNEEKIDTPKEMVIWKCGYSCDGPAAAGSEKWIKDVDYYYKQMIN